MKHDNLYPEITTTPMPQSPGDGAEMYVKYDNDTPVAYAYGEPWVAQALLMDDIGYPTPEEAKKAWENLKDRLEEMDL